MIKIHLSKILGELKWSQAHLSRLTGIRPNAISDIYNEVTEKIDIDYLDLICEATGRSLSDLLEYIPNKKPRTGTNLIKDVRRVNKKNTHSI